MKRRFFHSCISIAIAAMWAVITVANDAHRVAQPNILFILTDDQSCSSLSCYGNKLVATPNLDKLAAAGMRFTDAYVMPQCTPTRAALLTGEHTARNRMWHVIPWYATPYAPVAEPRFRQQLEPENCRLPHALRKAGYVTGMAGKWHLTTNQHGHYTHLKQASADAFGFDFVAPPGEGSQNDGDKWVDHLTDTAIDFVQMHPDDPWFFYLSHHTLHGKVSAPDALVQKYSRQGAPPEGMHNATYLAAIEHLDNSIGRLMQRLDELGQAERTIVVFLSDNGGVDTSYHLPQWVNHPLDGSAALRIKTQEFDSHPLREGKGSVYEGGIRVPCLVRWPGVIEPGGVCDTPIHVVDWLPTLLSAAGTEFGRDEDGTDLLPLFRGGELPERSLYWYVPLYDLRWACTPAAIIRQGNWKLIEYFGDWYDREKNYHIGGRTELYRLDQDPSELRNLSEENPDKVSQLRDSLDAWLKSIPVPRPQSNPNHEPSRAFLEVKNRHVQ